MGPYGVDDAVGSRVHSEPNIKAYSSLEDPDLSAKRGINSSVPDVVNNERPISKSNYDALPVSPGESNILFVGGLPKDCTRREVGRILCRVYVSACMHWCICFCSSIVDNGKEETAFKVKFCWIFTMQILFSYSLFQS